MEISVKDLWTVFKKSAVFMLIGAVLFSVVFWCYTSIAVQKVYQSSAKYILVPKDGVTEDLTSMNNSLVVAGKVIPNLKSYLMNEKTMESVLAFIEARHAQLPDDTKYVLENDYTAARLLSLFNFIQPNSDEAMTVFEVRCKAYSSADAEVLLDAFGNIINERSGKVLSGIYHVETSTEPTKGGLVAPNATTNTMLGAIIGAVVPYIMVLVYFFLDTRIKTEADVKNRFAAFPILGQIPRL